MNTILWALQIILAIKFLSAAYTHVFQTDRPNWRPGIQKMGARARLVLTVSAVCSVLGAVGLILPAATGILPWLTPLAAALLALLMVRGIVFHLGCRDRANVVAGVVLVILSAIVAYGRWVLVPL
jgi:ABC-type transport system involved in cytochrome c biogenesis permease subunit